MMNRFEIVTLFSNKQSVLWIGIPVHVPQIKSFKLSHRSSLPQVVHLSIKGSSSSFYFTDDNGGSVSQFKDEYLQPKTDKTFYVCLYPTNSDYHLDYISILVGGQKLKIDLFGYAKPAIVNLKGFIEVDDPNDMNKKALMKSFSKRRGITKFTLSLFNSGARTACVCLKSIHKNVTFQPGMLMLIPNYKSRVKVTINMTRNESIIQFFMYSADEVLRRASRISVRELPSDDIYNLFNYLDILKKLPDEIIMQQGYLPKFELRPYLYRQLMKSKKICYFKFADDDIMSSGSETEDESSTTANEFESPDINAFDGDDYDFHQTLSNVLILKDNNIFTPISLIFLCRLLRL